MIKLGRMTTIGLGASLVLAAGLSYGQSAFSPIDVRIPVSPRPFNGAGRTHLVYELHVTNLSVRQTTLDAVEVRDLAAAGRGEPLLRLEGASLDAAIRRLGALPADSKKRILPGGRTALVFMWVAMPPGSAPASLTHRFTFHVASPGALSLPSTPATNESQSFTVAGVDVAISPNKPRVIGPPLQGDHWLAANGPDNEADHRRTLLALSGEGRIAQRFAIDWVRLYDDGRTWTGDASKNASYRAYGASVLAVADGRVSETRDGIPENVPDAVARAVPITPDTLGGNCLLVDIGNGAYAFYAHLQPGSLKVKKGDKVRRGQVLALLGNSGNSSEPHLHFHVVDRNAAFDAEGIPYAFESFELEAAGEQVTPAIISIGNSLGIDPSVMAKWGAGPALHPEKETPLRNAIVKFPD